MADASGAKPGSLSSDGRTTKEPRKIEPARQDPVGFFEASSPSVSRVTFRSLAETVTGDESLIEVQHREVNFVGQTQSGPDLSINSFSGAQDSTLPMAYDNRRFFEGDEGYYELLKEASRAMDNLIASGEAWGEPNMEMGLVGWLWRCFVRFLMWMTNDELNRLRFTRGIQDALPFQMGYESFVIGGVVRAFDVDDRSHDIESLKLCFKNRNASRVIVQNLSRWDWFWHLGPQITWSRTF